METGVGDHMGEDGEEMMIDGETHEVNIVENSMFIGVLNGEGNEKVNQDKREMEELSSNDDREEEEVEIQLNARISLSDGTSKSYCLNETQHTIAAMGVSNFGSISNSLGSKDSKATTSTLQKSREKFDKAGPDKKRKVLLGINLPRIGKNSKVKKNSTKAYKVRREPLITLLNLVAVVLRFLVLVWTARW